MYAIPCNAEFVLKIDPMYTSPSQAETCHSAGMDESVCHNARKGNDSDDQSIRRMFEGVDGVSLCGERFLEGVEKWEGGVVGVDGAMYCMPQASMHVMKIDP